MNIWFWIFAILSTFGFALQWALMTKFVRKGDPLSMSVYRSLSFGISMLPLLIFSSQENIYSIIHYQPQLLFAGLCITLNVWLLFTSYRVLPIGISGAMRALFYTVFAIIFGIIFFSEYLDASTLIFIGVALIGGIILGSSKSDFSHLETTGFLKGLFFAGCSGIFSAISVIIMVDIARDLDPFVAGYFWEFEAGLIGLIVLYLRYKIFSQPIERISKSDFTKILLASSPTLIGSLGIAIAATLGPIGIASAIGTLGIVFITIFGVVLFGERLKRVQYLGMAIIIFGILGIKLI